ncbi:hypothetical protein VTK73DRAFT_7903 [Phialemonium thermophilum]|uniref:Uncharacterized protein n=1 Tax=Phialemonium thermophilum TaxID=223376 RepID=A0ABR3WBX6_9PEZI
MHLRKERVYSRIQIDRTTQTWASSRSSSSAPGFCCWQRRCHTSTIITNTPTTTLIATIIGGATLRKRCATHQSTAQRHKLQALPTRRRTRKSGE